MLRNPYLNRSMLRSLERFFGRRSQIERIMGRLDSPTPQSVALVGERRTGKSSLLWHLGQEEIYSRYLEQAADYVFCYIDFQRQMQLDQQGFCRVFAFFGGIGRREKCHCGDLQLSRFSDSLHQ